MSALVVEWLVGASKLVKTQSSWCRTVDFYVVCNSRVGEVGKKPTDLTATGRVLSYYSIH
jgi:hypothetical protein